jgi:ketosteroid isomerase-like protein
VAPPADCWTAPPAEAFAVDAKQRRREQRRLDRLQEAPSGPGPQRDRDRDRDEIAVLVETFRRGFAELDLAALTSIWDPDFDVIHCPIERAQPLHGKSAIDGYYDAYVARFARVHAMELGDLSIDVLGDAALAFFGFHFEGDLADGSGSFAVDGRDTIGFRRVGGRWAAIHYHESSAGSFPGTPGRQPSSAASAASSTRSA